MGCFVLTTFPKLCYGSSPAIYDERYHQKDYVPDVVDWYGGKRIVAPDTPYIAAVSPNQLYFIDKKFDHASAAVIKEQLERLNGIEPHEFSYIDEIDATAEIKNSKTKETVFKFNPAYARVFFAEIINRKNATLDLPLHEPAGAWLVTYKVGGGRLGERSLCADCGCEDNSDCLLASGGLCSLCVSGRVDNSCALGTTNAIGVCHPHACASVADTPKHEGETDTDYYKRMDLQHWQQAHTN